MLRNIGYVLLGLGLFMIAKSLLRSAPVSASEVQASLAAISFRLGDSQTEIEASSPKPSLDLEEIESQEALFLKSELERRTSGGLAPEVKNRIAWAEQLISDFEVSFTPTKKISGKGGTAVTGTLSDGRYVNVFYRKDGKIDFIGIAELGQHATIISFYPNGNMKSIGYGESDREKDFDVFFDKFGNVSNSKGL